VLRTLKGGDAAGCPRCHHTGGRGETTDYTEGTYTLTAFNCTSESNINFSIRPLAGPVGRKLPSGRGCASVGALYRTRRALGLAGGVGGWGGVHRSFFLPAPALLVFFKLPSVVRFAALPTPLTAKARSCAPSVGSAGARFVGLAALLPRLSGLFRLALFIAGVRRSSAAASVGRFV